MSWDMVGYLLTGMWNGLVTQIWIYFCVFGTIASVMGMYNTGAKKGRVTVEDVLVDPMTNEEMSKTFDLITQEEIDNDPELSKKDLGRKKYTDFDDKPKYIVRDKWFRLNIKFLWKDAPEIESLGQGQGRGLGGMM